MTEMQYIGVEDSKASHTEALASSSPAAVASPRCWRSPTAPPCFFSWWPESCRVPAAAAVFPASPPPLERFAAPNTEVNKIRNTKLENKMFRYFGESMRIDKGIYLVHVLAKLWSVNTFSTYPACQMLL